MSVVKYIPPYQVSEEAVNLIADISAAIERYSLAVSGVGGLRLRKINRVKTIRGSTAIEGNSLTEDQITALLDGQRVTAPKKEIDEVLAAAAAYEQIEHGKPPFSASGGAPSTPHPSRTLSGRTRADTISPSGAPP